MRNEFIELNRTFSEHLPNADEHDAENWLHSIGGEVFDWSYLINEYRVVILSEAGSGKTEEIRNITRQIQANNKFAFFLRLEHLCDHFELAFEEGTFEEFIDWKQSDEEAWFFLDSVDESRLRNPQDFELAIKKLSLSLGNTKQRVHIVITGRISGWRPITDLALCEKQLPYVKPIDKVMDVVKGDSSEVSNRPQKNDKARSFRIFSINELNSDQVEIFANAKDVIDIPRFLEEIERADANIHTKRPLDLDELVAFWKEHQRIGNRLELMRNSINSRLAEHDETRAIIYKIPQAKLLGGAKKTAAASMLANEPTLQIPDGTQNSNGFSVRNLLKDWDESECSILLSRPIFDKAIYGTVRFYHRSVREYLAAEWFNQLLKQNTSRRKIESLFFTTKYGIPVIVPRMRPILPWLALLDENIRNRLVKHWPEVLFEGGDPSQLPLDNRKGILQDVCDRIAKGEPCRSIQAIDAIQRFADPNLADVIRDSLFKKSPNNDLQWFLLRMVWQGRIIELLPEAMKIASDPAMENDARVAAIRATMSLGTVEDIDTLKNNIGAADVIDRYVFAELIAGIPASKPNIDWFYSCLSKVKLKQRHHSETLTINVDKWITNADANLLPSFIEQGEAFLSSPPVIDRRHCEISENYLWLTSSLSYAIEKLIKVKDANALSISSLSILRNLPHIRFWDPDGYRPTKIEFHQYVSSWLNLKLALFWRMVEMERAWEESNNGGKVTSYGQSGIFSSYVTFTEADFDVVIEQINLRPLLDDKLVALSLAHSLFVEAGKPASLKKSLKTAASTLPELEAQLNTFFNPPPLTDEQKKSRRQHVYWKRKAESDQRKNAKAKTDFREYLKKNPDTLRDPLFDNPEDISKNQYYLLKEMREKLNKANDRNDHNWKILIEEFGEEVAKAFRDGVVEYWRRYTPVTVSEGGDVKKYNVPIIFGLAGLAIEAHEDSAWPTNLSVDEVKLAFKYALFELNGFPKWLPKIYSIQSALVIEMVWKEIYCELTSNLLARQKSNYLLSDVNYSGEWMWNDLASHLIDFVQNYDILDPGNLRYVLNILQGSSSITDEQLTNVSSKKSQSNLPISSHAYWVAVWTGVDASHAIEHLETFLESQEDEKVAIEFCLIFITQLIGGRRDGNSYTRMNYRTPNYLRKLYILMNRYIKISDDIDRANGGVYSPTMRDDAQDARSHLYQILENIPGKEAYEALVDIAMEKSEEFSKPWFMLHANNRASKDADLSSWSIEKIIEFNRELECIPTNHQELFNLAELRILDLKDDLEHGDSSFATGLIVINQEVEIRKYIGNWCREQAKGRYTIPQEEQLADDKRPDFRWHGNGFDGPVPMELKLADKWSGPSLFERLRVQLNEDYLRDNRSSRGLFVLVNRATKTWEVDDKKYNFCQLVEALQAHWQAISHEYPKVEEIKVIGIDLTLRAVTKPKAKKPKKSPQ